MIVAFDTYYYNGYSYTVGGVFENWTDKKVNYYVTSKRECIDAEYVSGELYKRELPCIMQCIKMLDLNNIDTIIVDGFVWLTTDGTDNTLALGMRLFNALKEEYNRTDITIIGIAKTGFHWPIPGCVEIKRGVSKAPLYVTCSNKEETSKYATLIEQMYGAYRLPDIIKAIDSKTRDINDVRNKPQPTNKTYHIMTYEEWIKLGKPVHCGLYIEDK